MKRLADYLDNKIYYMLLFTVAVIPLHQEFTAFCVGVTFLAAALVAYYKGHLQRKVDELDELGVGEDILPKEVSESRRIDRLLTSLDVCLGESRRGRSLVLLVYMAARE